MRAATVGTIAVLAGCTTRKPAPHLILYAFPICGSGLAEVARRSRQSTVNFALWSGDEERNRYLRGKVADELKRRHDIRLRITPLSDTADAVNKLLTERSGNKTG